ncbi:unnamed protein product, partial [Symbiodinium microadriaticum]
TVCPSFMSACRQQTHAERSAAGFCTWIPPPISGITVSLCQSIWMASSRTSPCIPEQVAYSNGMPRTPAS